MNPSPSHRLPELTPEELERRITAAVIEGTRPLKETVDRQQHRLLELEAMQHQLSQTVTLWAQQLKNELNPKPSSNKPSRQEKQLKMLSAALSTWHRNHEELLAAVTTLSEKLDADSAYR